MEYIGGAIVGPDERASLLPVVLSQLINVLLTTLSRNQIVDVGITT